MTQLYELWLPILLSSVVVFLVSSAIHMATPWHKSDYGKVPNEDRVTAALRPFAIPPGDYMVPRPASGREVRSPEFLEKVRQGPVMIVTVLPNRLTPMGTNLALWFLYSVIVGVFAAYVAGRALPHGAAYWAVVRFAAVTAFLGYAGALWQLSIWYRRAWWTTIHATVDGFIYGLLTGCVFGWLWPH